MKDLSLNEQADENKAGAARERPPRASGPVQSLGRVLDVLSLFTAERPELSLSEVAHELRWPAPTTHRAIATLVDHGYLTRDPRTRQLRLGPAVLRLVAPLLAGVQFPDLARPHLKALAQETGETANLAVLEGSDVVYLLAEPGTFRVVVQSSPGLRLRAAHCTAIGKCLLAQLEPSEAWRRLGPEPYETRTDHTIQTWSELEPALAAIRQQGFALSVNEYEEGLLGCAVPLGPRNDLSAAINVAVPATRMTPEEVVDRLVPRLRATARAIDAIATPASS